MVKRHCVRNRSPISRNKMVKLNADEEIGNKARLDYQAADYSSGGDFEFMLVTRNFENDPLASA